METFTPKKLRILISILFVTMCSVAQVNVTEDFETGNFPFTLWQDGGDRCVLNTSSFVNGNNSVAVSGLCFVSVATPELPGEVILDGGGAFMPGDGNILDGGGASL